MAYTKAALLVAVLTAAFLAGWTANGWRYQAKLSTQTEAISKQIVRVATQNLDLQLKLQKAVDDGALKQARLAQAEQEKALSIKKAVAEYEASRPADDSNRHCTTLDADWVRIHNDAASAVPTDATAASRPFVATPAVALDTVTDNYSIARQCQLKLKGWQDWWAAVGG